MSRWLLAGGVGLFLSIFLVRSVYAFVRPGTFGGDSFDHLLYARAIARNGHRIPRTVDYLATGGFVAYPYLLHWVVSFVPRERADTLDNYASAVFDVLYALLFIIAAVIGVLTPVEALVAGVVFLATPQFVRPDMSHGTGLSARKPGQIQTTIAVFGFLLWSAHGDIGALAVSVLAGASVFLTSKFAVQAFGFIMAGAAVAVNPLALVVVASALAVALLISKGRYLEIAAAHYRHLKNYALEYQFRISYTKPTDLRAFLADLRSVSGVTDAFRLSRNNAIIRPSVSNPFLLGLVGLVALGKVPSTPVSGFYAWILAGVGAFAVTSLPYLRFLGQAERYLEFTFFPAAILLSRAWLNGGSGAWIVASVVVAGVGVIAVYIYGFRTILGDDCRADFLSVSDYLDSMDTGDVLIQPRWRSAELAWRSDHAVVDISINAGSTPGTLEEANQLYPGDAGYFTDDVDWLRDRYDPDWIVFQTDGSEYPPNALEPPDERPAFVTDCFEVYPFDTVAGP